MLQQKYIQRRVRNDKEEYLVFPPTATRTLLGVRGTLDAAIDLRNRFMGYDPDLFDAHILHPGRSATGRVVAGTVTFGALGDTHLCDKFERLDVLYDLYDRFAEAGVKHVFHTGNLVTGQNSKTQSQVSVWGLDDQVEYAVNHYPQVGGITTWGIDGDDHEGWWFQREGVHFGPLLANKRNDYRWLGYVEGNVALLVGDNVLRVRLIHPGGGSAFSVSHATQKWIDRMPSENRPDLLLCGHFHKGHYLPSYGGVTAIQTGCCVDGGAWAHKQPINYHIGGWIITATLYEDYRRPDFEAKFLAYEANEWAVGNTHPVLVEV